VVCNYDHGHHHRPGTGPRSLRPLARSREQVAVEANGSGLACNSATTCRLRLWCSLARATRLPSAFLWPPRGAVPRGT